VCPQTKRESNPHSTPFLGIVNSFSGWVEGFPQGLREGSIVHSTETGIKCFGAAFWKFRLKWSVVGPFFGLMRNAILKQTKTELTSDTVQLRHTGVTTRSSVL
jgi:hypothetical protein